jgi:phage shock protein PspC (stress-responsive transcriptional regulator)
MVAGVAAGIARYLGADVTIVRIVFVVLAFVGGAGLPLYLAGWLLMPEEGSDQSIAGDFIRSRQSRAN